MVKDKVAKEETRKDGKKEAVPTFENKFNPYHIVEAPLATEKCIRLIEFDNILVFLVNPRATKREVKRAVEELFKVKVSSVNIQNSVKGKKKAYVKLDPNYSASDVSADLGFI